MILEWGWGWGGWGRSLRHDPDLREHEPRLTVVAAAAEGMPQFACNWGIERLGIQADRSANRKLAYRTPVQGAAPGTHIRRA